MRRKLSPRIRNGRRTHDRAELDIQHDRSPKRRAKSRIGLGRSSDDVEQEPAI